MVNRAFDKVRQAGGAMPAVVIRLLDAITHVVEHTVSGPQRVVLGRQAEMILGAADRAVLEPRDLSDIRSRSERVRSTIARLDQLAGADDRRQMDRRAQSLSGPFAADR